MGDLIERSRELAATRELLTAAAAGRGRSLLLAGPAGIGKSALVRHAMDAARTAGFIVLASSPTPVTTALSHAVVRDWLGTHARRGRRGERPFDGPAADLSDALTDASQTHHVWHLAGLDYALTWALESLAELQPLLLVVDDVQWADVGSLQLLDLLSARLHQMSAALLLGQRTGEPAADPHVLERIGTRARRVEPAPLSEAGVAEIARRARANGVLIPAAELHRLTGGVPFLVREVLRSGVGHGAPRTVVASVAARLDRLGGPAMAVARAAAVLGDEADLAALATVAGLDVADLADPLALLTEAAILEQDTWRARPAHPLVAEAILSTMSPSVRSDLHRTAARYLLARGTARQVVASHLVHTLPGGDPEVVDLLRAAGAESMATGTPAVAARQLQRAVSETGTDRADAELLARAATAHLAAGSRDDAYELWAKALDREEDPDRRATLLADIGDLQMTMGDRRDAAESYRRAQSTLVAAGHTSSSPRMRHLLVRMGLTRALYDGARADIVDAVTEAIAQPPAEDTHTDRLLFALAASDLAVRGQERTRARELALRALGDGALLAEETSDGIGFYVASGVLTWTDGYAENLHALEAATEDARRRGSVLGFASASYCRGLVHARQGRMHEALADVAPALELRERGWPDFGDTALAAATLARVGLGHLDEARALEPQLRAAARRGQFVSAQLIASAGIVRAAHGDQEQALEDYRGAARLMGTHRDNASIVEWRELSAWSLAALGRYDEARELAEEALGHARVWGAPRALGFALRTLARVSTPEEGVGLLQEAETLLDAAGCTDQLIRAWLERAQLLSGSGRASRDEAVALLRHARERARQSGLEILATRATRALVRAGETVSAGPHDTAPSLTPGERRVVELAAAGDTNRQIAQKLFVTVKAVEWHLSNAYRKLGISSRAELPAALYGDSGPSSSSAI